MSNKTLPPTQRRIEKARIEGQVGKSPLLTQSFGMLVALTLIMYLSSMVSLDEIISLLFRRGTHDPGQALLLVVMFSFGVCGVILFPCAVVGMFLEGAQLGWRVLFGSGFNVKGKFSVSAGLKRLRMGITTVWLPLSLIVSLLGVVYSFYSQNLVRFIALVTGTQSSFPYWMIQDLVHTLGVWLMIAGAIDYWMKRRQHEKTLLMDHDELKRESKDSEGDPSIRAQRKALHQALVMQDLERRIKRASCVFVERAKRREY